MVNELKYTWFNMFGQNKQKCSVRFFGLHIYIYIYICICIYMYMYIYVYVCVCVEHLQAGGLRTTLKLFLI